MENAEVIAAVLAWVEATLGELGNRTYSYPPAAKAKALPDCVCELASEGMVNDDPDFPDLQLQQVGTYAWSLGLSIMVNAGKTEAEAEAAQNVLYDFGERLKVALFADPTLGQRVPFASPTSFLLDYTPPFASYDGGVRGRELSAALRVGEPVQLVD